MNKFISYEDFEKVNIRLGTIIKAHESTKLKKPSIILEIDFGEKIGIKKSFEEIENSDIVLLVDEKDPAAVYSQIKNKIGKRPVVLVCNKSDLNKQKPSGAVINISCKKMSLCKCC